MTNLPAEIELTEFKKETVVKTVTDPKTLRPKSASSEAQTLVTVDGKTSRQVETRRYTFEWK